MASVVLMFLDADRKTVMFRPLSLDTLEAIHMCVLEIRLQPGREQWAFIAAIEADQPLKVLSHMQALQQWSPTSEQRKGLLKRLEAEELNKLRAQAAEGANTSSS